MAKIPFHRRLLPWLFALIFLFMAPAVVFYTAGYRWNPKKNVIERNGTLIIDSQPAGASVKLNGQSQTDATPITLQNMSPGSYQIDLSLKGYHAWSKTLSIEPERVTFASAIILWPIADPTFIAQTSIKNLYVDADSGTLIAAATSSSNGTVFGTLDGKTGEFTKKAESNELIDVQAMELNSRDISQLLVQGQASGTPGVWQVRFSPPSVNKLPVGDYHWQTDGLTGLSGTDQLTIRGDQSVVRAAVKDGIVDMLDNWRLKKVAQTSNLILTQGDTAQEGLILPDGQWRFWSQIKNTLVFKDQNHWLWMDMGQTPVTSQQATGDWLLPITYKRQTQFVIKNDNEVWVWQQDQAPELIYRQSDPIVSVAWHPEGQDIMVSTKHDIMMFSLDARDVRSQTTLASFDQIRDATLFEDSIYAIGTKNNKTGLWSLPITLKTSTFPALSNFGL